MPRAIRQIFQPLYHNPKMHAFFQVILIVNGTGYNQNYEENDQKMSYGALAQAYTVLLLMSRYQN